MSPLFFSDRTLRTMSSQEEGIIAVSTAVGRSGIGIVRLSGSEKLARFMLERMTDIRNPSPRYAHFSAIRDQAGEIIDRGVVIWFKAPHSYTGEDVVEFQTHGNPVIQNLLIRSALLIGAEAGLRLAEPGEFTRRAFENGRIDLAQAESVMDLINASSESAVRAAEKSLVGEFSEKCRDIEGKLIDLRTHVEAILDFPEEDIDFIKEGRIRERVDDLNQRVGTLLEQASQGNMLREGVVIALVGSPNVGKSSLLNSLSEREVAIVTDIPGTTRDIVENTIIINGLQVNLVDTAGLRETADVIEQAGIRKAMGELSRADLILHLEAPETLDSQAELDKIKHHVQPGTKVITVTNKIDLLRDVPGNTDSHVYISAKTGEGIEKLKTMIFDAVGFRNSVQGVFIARRRHIESLQKTKESLEKVREYLSQDQFFLDMVAEELRLAGVSMGQILGEFTSDQLLGKIFSTFCIGK